MSRCRSCGAEIRWIKTKTGKNTPVDAKGVCYIRDPQGKETFLTLHGEVERGRRVEDDKLHTPKGYISHFSTCPDADDWRKR